MINPRRLIPAMLTAAGIALLAGCSAAGSEQPAELLRVGFPLREPVWDSSLKAVFALGESGGRVARVEVAKPGSRPAVRSKRFEDAGENLAFNPKEPELIYLARPNAGEISAINTSDIEVDKSYDVGGSPNYLALADQARVLFALSEDGSKVAAVRLEGSGRIPATGVNGDKNTLIESPEKGLAPAFWTMKPDGVGFYAGDPPRRLTGKRIKAGDFVVDAPSSQRVFVARGDRVVALEGDRAKYLRGRLVAVANRNLNRKVERLASDDRYVYAAAKSNLIIMGRITLKPEQTVDFGPLLKRRGIGAGAVSGITVGDENVYLTLEGEPYIVSVKKP